MSKRLPKTFKCSKNQKLPQNSNFKNFSRSSFGEYIHVNIYIVTTSSVSDYIITTSAILYILRFSSIITNIFIWNYFIFDKDI